jgi:hypothetical protein
MRAFLRRFLASMSLPVCSMAASQVERIAAIFFVLYMGEKGTDSPAEDLYLCGQCRVQHVQQVFLIFLSVTLLRIQQKVDQSPL